MGVKVREKPPGSGVWWIFIDHQGKRKAKKVGDKKTAAEAAKKIEAKLTLGDCGLMEESQQVPPFSRYADIWISSTIPATCKASTLRDYQTMLKRHVLPVFGKTLVTELSRLDVKKFLQDKTNAGFAGSTVTHLKNCLSGALNLAIDDGILQANPAHKLGRVIRSKGLQIDIDPFNREEISLLLAGFHEHYPTHYPMALTLARTGMRLGEALALQWGDIDFHGRFITIQRNFSRGKIETPKSGKSRRVDMSMQLSETLKDLKHQRRLEVAKNGWGRLPEWVFVSEKGTAFDSSHFRSRVFNRVLDKAGLRKVRVHDLRHSYAAALIQAGESLAYIRDQLGHHSIKVTVDIYGHLAPEGNKAAVDRLDDHPTATIRNLSATTKQKGAMLIA
jgi:integrase